MIKVYIVTAQPREFSKSPSVGRFAPSPTGPLHFGSLLTAVASFLDARQAGGAWLVRMEDVDEPRCRKEWANDILRSLESHQLCWDGDVAVQSERKNVYEEALAQLRTQGALYPCSCTRKELEHGPRNPQGEVVYPGTCAGDRANPLAPQFAERFRVGQGRLLSFEDGLFGLQEAPGWEDVGDFVVKRADGYHAYHLAVVVDDALQGVTEVVRGSDLLFATPKHLLLQRALGFPTPRYLHLPIATNTLGEKLSKQTKAPALDSRRASDNLVDALVALGQMSDASVARDLRCESPASILGFSIPRWNRGALPRRATFVAEGQHG